MFKDDLELIRCCSCHDWCVKESDEENDRDEADSMMIEMVLVMGSFSTVALGSSSFMRDRRGIDGR